MKKKILITGINGQDGYYLTEILLAKGYEVLGLDLQPGGPVDQKVRYYSGSIADLAFLTDLLLKINPDMIFNLASIAQVSSSFNMPEETFAVNLLPVIRMLELIREKLKSTRYLQATSSEIFGGRTEPPYNESSALDPMSPYAVSKEAAYHLVKIYRDAYNIFASNAILFNHTSPRHTSNYVVPKIVKGLVAVKIGKSDRIRLGNLDVERDWGYAGDYVRAMALILAHEKADDFVIGTGQTRSLKAIVEHVLNKLDLSYNNSIEIDPALFRLNDPKRIYADPAKIMRVLGWRPEKSFEDVLDGMIEEEQKRQMGKDG